jgi:hypothetical protein
MKNTTPVVGQSSDVLYSLYCAKYFIFTMWKQECAIENGFLHIHTWNLPFNL